MDARATGGLIAARRRDLGLTQGELADRLHVTDKAVSRWETGRGMPGLDILEPLAEALEISVTELLSGRELAEEELPKTAGEQIMEGLRKGRQRLWQGAAAMLALLLLLAGGYRGIHYFSTVPEGDIEALERAAAGYIGDIAAGHQIEFQYGELQIVQTQRRGDYLAALCVDGGGRWALCIYDRDRVFPDRWRANGSALGMRDGEIQSWNYGSPQGEAVIVWGGWNLPWDVNYYSFRCGEVTYTSPVAAGGWILDIFLIPDSDDIAGSLLELQDGEHRPLPYKNPRKPGKGP